MKDLVALVGECAAPSCTRSRASLGHRTESIAVLALAVKEKPDWHRRSVGPM